MYVTVVFNKSDAIEPFSFRFIDDDGAVILKSENYKAKNSALNGIESVKKNAVSEKRYDLKTAKNGKFYFNLKSTNGQIVGTSTMFANEVDRQKAMTLLGGDAASALLDDQSGAAKAATNSTAQRPKPRNSEQLEPSVPIAEQVISSKAVPKPKPTPKKAPAAKASKATGVKKTAAPNVSKTGEEKPSKTAETQSSKSLVEKEEPKRGIKNFVGYIGKAASFGISIGTKPMRIFGNLIKGFYNKISK